MLILNCTKFDEYMYKFISLTLDNFCIFWIKMRWRDVKDSRFLEEHGNSQCKDVCFELHLKCLHNLMQIANDYICDIAGPNNEFTDGDT